MTDSDTLPFYNYLGQIEYLSGYALSFGDWSPSTSEPLSVEQQSLIDDISGILLKSPTESHIRAENINLTLEVDFEDGSKVIARKILPKDGADLGVGILKLVIEARLLKWLAESTNIPVPRILSPLDVQDCNVIIMNKLPGAMLLNMYGTLDTSAKERLVEAYALIALDLFALDVPQRIGTLVPDLSSGSFDVTPMISVYFRAIRVFEDISGNDGGHNDELKRHTERVLTDLLSSPSAPTLLRCVLVHRDLNDMNILVDKNGSITGVVDWEYQALQPAVLTASYPPWLSYDGCNGPHLANKQTFWLENPKESKRLRDLYLKIVKSKNHKYWEALVLGTRLRSCIEWLLNTQSDPGCKRMKKWMNTAFSAYEPGV